MGYMVTVLIVLMSLFVVFKLSLILFREIESPRYHVISKHQNIEIREYPPMIQVGVVELGTRQAAIQKGFSQLAAYIFGKNATQQKIKMTAPVVEFKVNDAWNIRFILPAHWQLNELPKPLDDRIEFIEMPAQRIAAIRFSGRVQDSRLEHYTEELKLYLESRACELQSSAIYAFYNPPWTLPFLRRNEIWYLVDLNCRL